MARTEDINGSHGGGTACLEEMAMVPEAPTTQTDPWRDCRRSGFAAIRNTRIIMSRCIFLGDSSCVRCVRIACAIIVGFVRENRLR